MHTRSVRKNTGFTLFEVMVTLFFVSVMCLSAFAGLQQITKSALAIAIRSEAYHLVQAKSEQLLAGDFASFAATASDESIKSEVKTSYSPSGTAIFIVTADDNAGRITFARRVVAVSSTGSSRTLRVEVQWTWQGRPYLVSTQLLRSL